MGTSDKSDIERSIYENALDRMKKFGTKSISSSHLILKRDSIKSSLLRYYESTEEFEKCKFITEFFDLLEKEIGLSQILEAIKKK